MVRTGNSYRPTLNLDLWLAEFTFLHVVLVMLDLTFSQPAFKFIL